MSCVIKSAGGMALALGVVLMAPSFAQVPAADALTPPEQAVPTALPEEDAYRNPPESVKPASPLDVTDELGHSAHVFPQIGAATQLATTTDRGHHAEGHALYHLLAAVKAPERAARHHGAGRAPGRRA